ncbi:prolactin receptor [Platysternon megacephalum]|uniref:Prolactin receptor n=1 Tax=Platysternon megacephalum TaxID=55544 RepID=A0A4D9EYF3_9SAUR|nr:prolactin receptor [Platysternon megacephalum]
MQHPKNLPWAEVKLTLPRRHQGALVSNPLPRRIPSSAAHVSCAKPRPPSCPCLYQPQGRVDGRPTGTQRFTLASTWCQVGKRGPCLELWGLEFQALEQGCSWGASDGSKGVEAGPQLGVGLRSGVGTELRPGAEARGRSRTTAASWKRMGHFLLELPGFTRVLS